MQPVTIQTFHTARSGGPVAAALAPSVFVGTPIEWYWKRGDTTVTIPEDTPAVLEWRYGADYMTPKPMFKGCDS